MKQGKLEYTTLAHRYTARHPLLTYLGIQVNFWMVANLLLLLITNFYSKISSLVFDYDMRVDNQTLLVVALVGGLLYGSSYGLLTLHLEQKFFRNLAIGKIILAKTIGSILLLSLLLLILRYVLFGINSDVAGLNLTNEVWDNIFYLLLMYYFFMAILISYINQVNKKYGPGVLLPLLLGRYRNPREEDKIFMFIDLKSSTATAEKLGHFKYSSFLRDYFDDINEILLPYRAQVYQYVGDEIVVMWPEQEGLINNFCVTFFFACKQQFKNRAEYYLSKYGIVPEFKAGLHSGRVSAVEIGEIRKDIAYHGDTLNTTARIQSICNEYGKDFLVSDHLINKINLNGSFKVEKVGDILLKGKKEKVAISSVSA
ncbi:adenylate/guanylate cyclase domain-containing protein [Fulvivirga lutimaris]|uniref:adenylate/guanylate cyclase domain-containing protein n=1 Tax=Fulvivirga lutimaris TaxID=1819566 RepID=UPI0012BC5184|nr:adenylate/guanylate cyclase domain-containing protein [Fulvivirga lutimaris]MTI39190.1 adenylate/guanylate cyclase domain-containing protein [Fulvivirga lutimaris]